MVTNTNDSGPGSLRGAIQYANTLTGLQTITFNIPGLGVQTIRPLTPLPTITTPVTIDGTSQPGFTGTPIIQIDGASASLPANGLQFGGTAATSTVEALDITDFGGGAGIDDVANGLQIIGNYIGFSTTGSAAPNQIGVDITGGFGATVGGLTAASRNVISGNTGDGIFLSGGEQNLVEGNYIGTNVTGTAALGNGNIGVEISGAIFNTIGGTTAAVRNIISGNQLDGVSLVDGGANNNLVEGNYIGTDASGELPLGNVRHGVSITATTDTSNPDGTNNTIGGSVAGAGNVISANGAFGVVIFNPNGSGLEFNVVQGNLIGTDAKGTLALGNSGDGIVISSAAGNTIGGSTAAARNIIAGNGKYGVDIEEATSTGNLVEGNYIGTDISGTRPLGNANNDVNIQLGASDNTIGGRPARATSSRPAPTRASSSRVVRQATWCWAISSAPTRRAAWPWETEAAASRSWTPRATPSAVRPPGRGT